MKFTLNLPKTIEIPGEEIDLIQGVLCGPGDPRDYLSRYLAMHHPELTPQEYRAAIDQCTPKEVEQAFINARYKP